MNNYLITLTPVNKFFFGGDMTFQVGEKDNSEFNLQFSSYIISSNYFPQQTSLLGMLRFLILSNSPYFKNDKITNTIEVGKLIGEKSFSVEVKKGNDETKIEYPKNDFGMIDSISECFLQYKGDNMTDWIDLSFLPFDSLFEVKSCDNTGIYNGEQKSIPTIEGFSVKNGYTKYVGFEGLEIPLSDIFVKDCRLGINRDITTGKVEDDALFKQICYRLADKQYVYNEKRERVKDENGNDVTKPCRFRFAFRAQINDNTENGILGGCNGQLVSIGGDNSQFIINLEEGKLKEKVSSDNKVVLQSPAYLTRKEVDNAAFAITEIVPFRFLNTSLETKSYHRLDNYVSRSVRYELYDRGSVFYFDNNNKKVAFVDALKKRNDFRQIGYNQYK